MSGRPLSPLAVRARWPVAAALCGVIVLSAGGCDTGAGTTSSTSVSPSPAPVPSTTTTTSTSAPPLTPLPRTFDETAVQDAVHKVLTESYQIKNLGVVMCPAHQKVEEGARFFCTTTVDGERKKIPIKVINDDGRYSVGMPE